MDYASFGAANTWGKGSKSQEMGRRRENLLNLQRKGDFSAYDSQHCPLCVVFLFCLAEFV